MPVHHKPSPRLDAYLLALREASRIYKLFLAPAEEGDLEVVEVWGAATDERIVRATVLARSDYALVRRARRVPEWVEL